jgi:hypothetical protein
MTSRHAGASRWTDDDRTEIVADRAPVPAQTYDPNRPYEPAHAYEQAPSFEKAPSFEQARSSVSAPLFEQGPSAAQVRSSVPVRQAEMAPPYGAMPQVPAYEVHGVAVPPAPSAAEAPPVRRTITVRLAAVLGVVAFLVGVGVSLLVGALVGPGDPGAGGPGGGFGGTPPGTSGQAVPGAPTDSGTTSGTTGTSSST